MLQVQQPSVEHRIGDRDPDGPGEVVVAGAGVGEGLSAASRRQRTGCWGALGCHGGEAPDQLGYVRTGQTHMAVAALPFLSQQVSADERVQVLRRGRGRPLT